MRDNDELKNIPPMVPDRDDVSTHASTRKSQEQEIVRPSYYARTVMSSSWQVRTLLTLIVLILLGSGYGAYYMYGVYQTDLRQAGLLIGDLEGALARAGDNADETAMSLTDRLDFNFSEIDKLWAARNATNSDVEDVRSEIAKLALVNEGQDETAASNSQQIANTNETIMAANVQINSLDADIDQLTRSVGSLNTGMQELQSMQGDLASIRQALNSGDSTVLGLVGRLEYIEGAMESVNAHRLQINESLFRLQENIEALQQSVTPPN